MAQRVGALLQPLGAAPRGRDKATKAARQRGARQRRQAAAKAARHREWEGSTKAERGLCRIVALCYPVLTHFILDSLKYAVPLFLSRRCDRTVGGAFGLVQRAGGGRRRAAGEGAGGGRGAGAPRGGGLWFR